MTGVFIVGFIQSVGGSDLWIGLISAIPSLVGLLQIPGAIWGRSFASYKRFVFPGGLMWRVLYVPLIALPLLPIPGELKLSILVICIAIASASVVLVNPTFNEWLAEMVPADSRGFFFSRRNAIAAAVGAGVGMIGAFVLDRFRASDQENLGFTVLFTMAIVCAGISLFFFTQMRDLRREHPVQQNLKAGIQAVRAPFGDREFRRVLVFLGLFVTGQMFAGNLFSAFARESLHLDFKIIQGTAVTFAIGNVLAAPLWGFLSDKYGNRPLLLLVGAALSLNPIPWILCQPGQPTFNAILLIGSHVLMGVVWGGVALFQFNLVLATAKPEDRANYIAAGMTITTLAGGLAPLFGASMMASLRAFFDPVTAYKVLFATTGLLRLVSVFLVLRVREEGSVAVGAALRELRGVTPKGMRAMRKLSRSADPGSRARAIESVGAVGFHLASDEIIKALHDPQPSVRREAASALARLQDPRAVAELIHQIEEHPDLVEEETVDALGELRDRTAVPALVATLRSPRSMLRRASAKALGRIGDPSATQALIEAASDPGDPDLRRSALQALRVLQARDAAPAIVDALLDPLPSVRIAASEAVSELRLTEAAPLLRQSLDYYSDEAGAEVAYALGTVGSADDIPLILREAERSVSMITRRRALLGVAKILDVEQQAYRLLLLSGMPRDAAVLEMLRPSLRKHRRLRVVMNSYSSGDEPGALQDLAHVWKFPAAQMLAATPVAEAFLVAAPAALRDLGV